MRLRSFFAALAIGTAAALSANLAHADLILNFQGLVSGAKTGTISVFNNGTYKNSGVSAGMLTFKQKAPGETSYASGLLGSFCIEPKTALLSGDTLFSSGALAGRFDQPQQNLIARLYDLHYEAVTTLTDAASAFQLALWEIVTDGANLSLSSGKFLTTSAFGTATALATTWINDLAIWNTQLGNQAYTSSLYDFVALSAGNSQDQLTVTRRAQSVPEPGVLALLVIGMAAGFAGRRRMHD
ncbi:PEP-CTERM sorting domain-containing protein [Azoarcus sp. L1K30]|uniref:PEP-CTERM sorting domain-containing protein n=1 Tax=Azoarcus sp. L1K30 TaxID=2820277 RepID=UPI001B842AF3|nr:PEP-CTERM sorting domain-containing protein [Azoarcus sp. L1K30]MBR0568020.1 PEP-CTERM sorting domain-containing protein [Azoarcus sp. L1K30]